MQLLGGVFHVLSEPVRFAHHAEHDYRPRHPAADLVGLTEDRRRLLERPHLQHARLARHQGQLGTQQEGATGLGVTARTVGHDVIGFTGNLREFVEDLVRTT